MNEENKFQFVGKYSDFSKLKWKKCLKTFSYLWCWLLNSLIHVLLCFAAVKNRNLKRRERKQKKVKIFWKNKVKSMPKSLKNIYKYVYIDLTASQVWRNRELPCSFRWRSHDSGKRHWRKIAKRYIPKEFETGMQINLKVNFYKIGGKLIRYLDHVSEQNLIHNDGLRII